ncbi:hypothetical protein [Fimbriimonas ginsengisoli]|uniref:Uncharacterized protein n=1 Tax=Fimbriimonas ginsengisoli Gsoil 348 TaxID=661478 RepID=A0A068NPN2_FIMGI|nr:hypothetical protein [Fimbriimonas ginsengisoli]AIE83534.1 hypothetical protein OP10G_0166 [Fimbriimonas ginsengisoli Gsoil 348]
MSGFATLNVAVGQDVVILITPQVRSGDGVTMTAHAVGTLSFVGRIENFAGEFTLETDNLSPVGSFNGNPVPHEQNGQYTIGEFVMASGNVYAAGSGSTAFPKGNVIRKVTQLSFEHKIEVQLWDHQLATPAQVDSIVAYMRAITPFRRNMTKPRVMDEAVFALIPLFDATTGAALPNPSFGSSY